MKTFKVMAVIAAIFASTLFCGAQDASTLIKAGEKAPAFSVPSPQGKMISLKDFKGKYLVIDFWASWCGDCRREAPELVELYKQYGGKNCEFLGISFDTEKDAWLSYVEKAGMKWPQASELTKWKETKVNDAYKLDWIPTFYLVDPKGKVVGGYFTAADLAKAMKANVR